MLLSRRSNASSLDVLLLSVFAAQLLGCAALVALPAARTFTLTGDGGDAWTRPLCTFYVWAWVTLR